MQSIAPSRTTSEKTIQQFSSDSTHGLSAQEAVQRLTTYGLNKLPEGKKVSLLQTFISQFTNPLIYILLIAATIIFFIGSPLDAMIISGVLFFNAIVGTIQEGRAHNILESLSSFIKSDAIVIRDGKKHIVPDTQLVPGDIIQLSEGEKIPADARIIESNNLVIDESMLTGESIGIKKQSNPLAADMPIHDQTNMVFRGTYVLSGFGTAIITATGAATEIGKLGSAVQEIETDTPLKQEVENLSHSILLFIFGICSFLFIFGLLLGKSFTELLVMLTALFICVIPEGLPLVLTITLVTGAFRMAQRNVLVKRLQAVEGLGRADVIIIDKTGTLTRNELIVTQVITQDQNYTVTGQGYKDDGAVLVNGKKVTPDATLNLIATACVLLDRSEKEFDEKKDLYTIKGEPIEAALGVFGKKVTPTITDYNRVGHIPFTTTARLQAGIFEHDNNLLYFVIGAPEALFEKTSPTSIAIFKQEFETLAKTGHRVIAVGVRTEPLQQPGTTIPDDLTILGLLAIQDTVRPDAKQSISDARDAGLRVIMATGDHIDTATFIAQQVGIFHPGDRIIDGATLDKLSDQELDRQLATTSVYARVTPEQKLRLVRAFQEQGHTVAMTGDGVNDAPSLVAADLGIGMGLIGTEVAKQASDMILLDDSFGSVVAAIKEGRHVFYTLRRIILYFFTTNLGEVLIVLFALLANLPLPITAAQILWLNLITDGFLDAALTMEAHEPGLLKKHAFRQKHLVDRTMIIKLLYMSIPMGIGSLFVFLMYYQTNLTHARTMVLVTMAMYQWFNAWNCRSENLSIFTLGLFSNRWLLLATGFVFALQLFLLNNHVMQSIFDTMPLSLHDWGLIIAITCPLLIVEEIRKRLSWSAGS